MKKWSRFGNNYYPAVEASVFDFPKTGVFKVFEEKTPGGVTIALQKICDKFEFDYKLYDLDTSEIEERIRNTWDSDLYKKSGKNLGIIYNGVKGTGKTVGAKILCNDFDNMPTLIISQYFKGISDFIQSIDFPCVVFIDEAEKIFDNEDSDCSVELLRMIDGVYSASRKIFILTTNTLSLNNNLLDRPSRIRYVKEFGNVSNKAVEEIIEDKLIDKSKKSDLLAEINKLSFSTIDIIENIIFEYNIHGNIIGNNIFNIPQKFYKKLVLAIDLKTYVADKVPIIDNIDTVVKLSTELMSDVVKSNLKKRGTNVELSKIIPDIETETNISFEDYVREWCLKNSEFNSMEDLYFYDNLVRVKDISSWSTDLFEGLELSNGDKIVEIKSDCFKAVNSYDNEDFYYGIIL